MIRKTFYIFLTLLFFSFIVFPKLSFAQVTLSNTELGKTSVVLRAEGLIPAKSVVFHVHTHISNQESIPYYLEEYQVLSDSAGIASFRFLGLTPGGMYVGTVNYAEEDPILGSVTFTTLSTSQALLNITNVGEDTVTLRTESLSPNATMLFNLVNKDSSTPSYLKSQQATTDNAGQALSDFSGLSPGGHYQGKVNYLGNNEILGTVIFYTFSSANPLPNPAPTPLPPPSPNPSSESNSGSTNSIFNGGLVPCGTQKSPLEVDPNTGEETGGQILNPCEKNGLGYLLEMINKVINFVLFVLAVPIAAIMFVYAGFLLITSGGETSKRGKAKSIFVNVAIGLVLAMAAWLIIHTILSLLGFDGAWIGF